MVGVFGWIKRNRVSRKVLKKGREIKIIDVTFLKSKRVDVNVPLAGLIVMDI